MHISPRQLAMHTEVKQTPNVAEIELNTTRQIVIFGFTDSRVLKQDVWSLGNANMIMFVLRRQDKLHHKRKNKLSNKMISRSATHIP